MHKFKSKIISALAIAVAIVLTGCAMQFSSPDKTGTFALAAEQSTTPLTSETPAVRAATAVPSSSSTPAATSTQASNADATGFPCDFMTADFTGKDAAILEKILGSWGFQYYKQDGKWTAEDTYDYSLFQRWAGLKPTGTIITSGRTKLQSTFQKYGWTKISRQKLPLEGKYIGINAGHQQKADYGLEPLSPETGSPKKARVSSGTQGTYTRVPEYKVTLQVALLLRDQLAAKGARVLMVRTTNNVHISNVERCKMMNTAGVDVYLSLHCDGNTNHSVHGLHTLIPAKRGYQSGAVLEKSQKLAKYMQTCEIKATGAASKGFSTRKDLSSFNWSKMPTCLIEMGFMTYKAEDKLLITSGYQTKLAKGIVEGFVQYFESID
jgi:N-acetylmuramoyl-L-alanine amidase